MTDSDDKKNYLRVRAKDFSLELEGDPGFILETYDNVRQDILKRLIQLIEAESQAPADERAATQAMAQLPESAEPASPGTGDRRGEQPSEAEGRSLDPAAKKASPEKELPKHAHYMWVYITHEIYNKVYVVDLATFNASPLSRFLDGVRLRKIYLDREFQEALGPLVGTGKTLWSELTKKGREQLASTGKVGDP